MPTSATQPRIQTLGLGDRHWDRRCPRREKQNRRCKIARGELGQIGQTNRLNMHFCSCTTTSNHNEKVSYACIELRRESLYLELWYKHI
jgi:hypothetical protein